MLSASVEVHFAVLQGKQASKTAWCCENQSSVQAFAQAMAIRAKPGAGACFCGADLRCVIRMDDGLIQIQRREAAGMS